LQDIFLILKRYHVPITRRLKIIKTFATHIIIRQKDASYIKKLDRNDDFYFDFREDPSFSNWETENGDYLSVQKEPSQEDITLNQKNYTLANELLIIAKDIEIAENVMNLVYGGMYR
jgi:hypothetical protein